MTRRARAPRNPLRKLSRPRPPHDEDGRPPKRQRQLSPADQPAPSTSASSSSNTLHLPASYLYSHLQGGSSSSQDAFDPLAAGNNDAAATAAAAAAAAAAMKAALTPPTVEQPSASASAMSASASSSSSAAAAAAAAAVDLALSKPSAYDLSADSTLSAATTSNGTTVPAAAAGGAPSSRTLRNGKGVAIAGAALSDDDEEESSEGEDGDSFHPIFEGSMIDQKELVRLTLQSLRDLGFESAAQALEKESGVKLEHPSITAFRTAVLSGEWKNADRLLMDGLRHAAARRLRHAGGAAAAIVPAKSSSGGGASSSRVRASSSSSSSINVNCVLRDPETQSLESIKFALQQQRFLELLEAGHNKKALSVLRDRLTPLNYGSERLHQLSSLMMCESPEQLRARARWDGANGHSRHDLLQEIESAVLPTVMIPSRRLPQLLEQAQMLQKQMDPYYNLDSTTEHLSLYVDIQSDRSGFPSQPTFKLYEHDHEVWTLDFSPDGTRLASGGKDQQVITYSVSPTSVEKLHVYGPFLAGGVSCVRWSPDSRRILCAAEEAVYLIDTTDGSHKVFKEHIYRITAVAWLPSGTGFVTGSMDGKVLFWNLNGQVTRKWEISPYRVLGLDVSANGRRMVVISYRVQPPAQEHSSASSVSYSESPSPISTTVGHHEDGRAGLSALMRAGQERNRIYFYDLESFSTIGMAGTTEEMTCASISKDSRYVLINKRPNETQVWDIELQEAVQVYQGHTIFQNVIGACFGGAEKSNFIITGSEDAKIYIYHRASGRTLERLSHGTGCVNSVAWHPTNKAMFASASDDSSVCVWQPGERRRGGGAGLNGAAGASGSGSGLAGLGHPSSSSNGFRRTSSGSALGGGLGAGDRSDARRKSEGMSALLGGHHHHHGGGGGPSGSGAGGSGGNGSGSRGGEGRTGAAGAGGHSGHGQGSSSESDSAMGGPIPFPWAVSPLRRDSMEDVSMMDEGMYDEAM
ncbi:hypothetical protein OC834_004966 [Tilletia horrida]|nr:hypothetical protein OC834_004966 [Tilletia horrida]